MSEWPKRYEPSLDKEGDFHAMFESSEGNFIVLEDFERLLTFTVNSLNPRHPFPWILDKLKESILLQLKKEAEND